MNKTRRRTLSLEPICVPEKTSDAPTGAVHLATQEDAQEWVKVARSIVVGTTMRDYGFTTKTVWLGCEAGAGILVGIDDDTLFAHAWPRDTRPKRFAGDPLEPEIDLEIGEWRGLWRPEAILKSRIGQRFTNVAFDGSDLYLYWNHGACVSFGVCLVTNSNDYCLHWEESD